MSSIVIFLGPSLPIDEARSILDALYLPPIKRGDLDNLPPTTTTVGIIDGEFYQSLAVSPKEVLRVLERGVAVFGASSMGALRAAELRSHGMVGIGEIFRQYCDEELNGDDEVAQTYIPETYRTTSKPLVDIRYALALAVSRAMTTREEAGETIKKLKQVYFPFRSYQALAHSSPELITFLHGCPSLKSEDAKLLLRHVAAKHSFAAHAIGVCATG